MKKAASKKKEKISIFLFIRYKLKRFFTFPLEDQISVMGWNDNELWKVSYSL